MRPPGFNISSSASPRRLGVVTRPVHANGLNISCGHIAPQPLTLGNCWPTAIARILTGGPMQERVWEEIGLEAPLTSAHLFNAVHKPELCGSESGAHEKFSRRARALIILLLAVSAWALFAFLGLALIQVAGI